MKHVSRKLIAFAITGSLAMFLMGCGTSNPTAPETGLEGADETVQPAQQDIGWW